MEKSKEFFDKLNIEENQDIIDAEAQIELIPAMNDPSWNQYVIKQFEPNELIKGYPTVDGLRRMVRKLIGEIIVSKAKVISYPEQSNGYGASCSHKIIVRQTMNMVDGDSPHNIEFTEVADVNMFNTDEEFAKFPTATASTRAEARALRKILRLSVCAAEELDPTDVTITSIDVEDSKMPISVQQKNYIEVLCGRLNIDINKYINMGSNKYKSMDDIKYSKAKKMIKFLHQMQNGTTDIPEEIKAS